MSTEWNARHNDEVAILRDKKWVKGTVTRTDIMNEHGHRLNLEVALPPKRPGANDQLVVVSPFSELLFIFPPKHELALLAPKILNYVKKYKNLLVVRKPSNSDEPVYQFCCMKCKTLLYHRREVVETGDFRYQYDSKTSGEFREGKPTMEQSIVEIVCGCKNKNYDEPADGIREYM